MTKAKMKAAEAPSPTDRRKAFIDVLRRTANISRAAREAGLSRATAYRHRAASPTFRSDWDAAIAEALDDLEDIVIDRVRNGVEKPIFYAGEEKGTMRVYSDALAMFILRAKRPEVYGGAQGVVQAMPGAEMTEAEATREVDRRLARLAGAKRDEAGAA